MNKQDWVEGLLFAGFRVLSVGLIVAGLLGLLFRLIEGWYTFDPSYLGPFLLSLVLRPGLVALAGLALYLFSGTLARRMAAGFCRGEP